MKIAVNTIPAIAGTVHERIFGTGLLNALPGKLPEAQFFYEQDYDTGFMPFANVQQINYREAVEDAVYLSLNASVDYNPELNPGIIFISDVDEKLFLTKAWWSVFSGKKDGLVKVLGAATALLVPHTTLRLHLIDLYGIAPKKIHVVGHGLPPEALRITPADSVTRRITRETYGNEHSYFLARATGHPSDNLERLFAAYDLFRQRCPEPVRLLVETDGIRLSRTVRKARDQAEFRTDIVLLPALSPAERRKVVSSARALVHVSLSTAFPLPVLDAWTAEVPSVSTDNAILQGAGTLVQGEDVKSIAEGLVSLVTTPFLASGLVENGKRRREDFSWERVAEQVAGVLSDLLTYI